MAVRFDVGVVVAKRKLKGPWADHAWLPVAVLPTVPETPPWTPLGSHGEDEAFYAGSAEIALYAQATGFYRDNLTSGRPSLWVVLRPIGDGVELVSVTADPYEGEALADNVGDIVEVVPMPEDVRGRIQTFFDAFHVERAFFKRKRDRADPEIVERHESARQQSREDDE
jgi:hypothetical protein